MINFSLFTEDKYSKYAELLDKKSAIIRDFKQGQNAKVIAKALIKINKEIKKIEKDISI